MFCAPIVLTGSGGPKSNYNALPDIFLANIGNGCTTVDGKDLVFPDPGAIIERLNGATTAFASAIGVGCKTGSGGPQPTGGYTLSSSTPAGGPGFFRLSLSTAAGVLRLPMLRHHHLLLRRQSPRRQTPDLAREES